MALVLISSSLTKKLMTDEMQGAQYTGEVKEGEAVTPVEGASDTGEANPEAEAEGTSDEVKAE